MRTWALANQKGGTGKTTVAVNLAASLAARGKRCLLVDLDPQAHATLATGISVPEERSLAAAFLAGRPLAELVHAVSGGFHLVPSHLRLGEFEERAEQSLGPERVLARALEPASGRYDWVLIDSPPRADGVLVANAVRAADTTCLVVETGAFALQGALAARRIFTKLARELGREPSLRVLATLVDPRERLSGEFLVALQARFGEALLDSVIRRHELLREAAAFGVPARELAPHSRPAREFDLLAGEIARLTDGPRTRPEPLPLRD